MRKVLLASLFMSLAVAGASAAPLWYDVVTNYPGGCITTNTANWYAHLPGSLTANDALVITNTYTSGAAVSGKRLRINGQNSEYIMRLFDPATTNAYFSGTVWASFIANANFVPAAGVGTYFAAFNNADTNNPAQTTTNGFDFRARVSEIGVASPYPYTTRVNNTKVFQWGIANAAADAPSGLSSILFPPIDAVANIDYQIVVKYNIDLATAELWVNPASESDTANHAGPTSDSGAAVNGLAGLLFRQRATGGTVDIRDVAVGLTFADVMTNVAASSPVLVATNYFNTVTNYTGNPALLQVFATSIGGGVLSYQWYQVSGGVTNPVGANSSKYVVASLASTDTGRYFCAVTNVGLQGALSSTNFYISVNTTPTPPFFTFKSPTPVNGSVGGALSLTNSGGGTGPLSYQWYFNNNPLTDGSAVTGNVGDLSVVSGSQTPILTVTGLSTNETGSYSVTVTSGAGGLPYNTTNTAVAVTVNPARAVSIAYIRSLEDTTTWQVTDTGSIFTITNAVVTMYTNVTSGTTASYYIQDATGGLDLFVTGDASFRPQMGDIVSVSGTLSSFSNAIELLIDTSNPYEFYSVVGHTNVIPAPVVIPLSATNSLGNMETNLEGKIVMITNVTFVGSLTTPSGNGSLYVTNAGSPATSGMQIFFPAGTDADVRAQVLQNRFAYTITGVMAQFKSGAYNNSSYELYVTRIGDIMTNPPPAVTATEARSGNDVILSWTAVPYTPTTRGAYSYSVLAATDVAGPYLPLATGMAFSTSNGTYTDVNALLGAKKFYRISSP